MLTKTNVFFLFRFINTQVRLQKQGGSERSELQCSTYSCLLVLWLLSLRWHGGIYRSNGMIFDLLDINHSQARVFDEDHNVFQVWWSWVEYFLTYRTESHTQLHVHNHYVLTSDSVSMFLNPDLKLFYSLRLSLNFDPTCRQRLGIYDRMAL